MHKVEDLKDYMYVYVYVSVDVYVYMNVYLHVHVYVLVGIFSTLISDMLTPGFLLCSAVQHIVLFYSAL